MFNRILHGGKRSTAAAFDPDSISDLGLWLDASDLSTLWTTTGKTTNCADEDDAVALWESKVGTFEPEQGTGSSQPKLNIGGHNGMPTVRFDGGDYLLDTDSLSGGTVIGHMSLFVVANNTASNAGCAFATSYSSVDNFRMYVNTNSGGNQTFYQIDPRWQAACQTVHAADTSSAFRVLSGRREGSAQYNAALNGTTQTNTGTDGGNNCDDLDIVIGCRNGGSNKLTGNIAELLAYNKYLSDTEYADVLDYLNTKWSVY